MGKKHLFTVFTPTHNRAHLIPKLYETLKNQTCKDFVWLVVDDGSTDNTKEIIESFQRDNFIDIHYHFIPNGYLHLAESYSAKVVNSEYLVRIDDDDWLMDNCLEVFKNEWEKIRAEGINDIVEIRALAVKSDGTIAGSFQPKINQAPIDTTYIERNFNSNTRLENIGCRRVDVWKQLFRDEGKWLYDKVTYISDSLFWCRLSMIGRTRYIFVPLRFYNDTDISITKESRKLSKQNLLNAVFGAYAKLNDMRVFYWKYPKEFFMDLVVYSVYGSILKYPFGKLLKTLDSPLCRFLFIPMWPIAYIYGRHMVKKGKVILY